MDKTRYTEIFQTSLMFLVTEAILVKCGHTWVLKNF